MEHLKKITMVRKKTCCSGGQYLIRPSSCPSSATIFSTTISLSVLDEYLDGNKAGKSHQSQGRGCALHCSGRLDPHQAEQGCGKVIPGATSTQQSLREAPESSWEGEGRAVAVTVPTHCSSREWR